MTTRAYLRVSTDAQDAASQRTIIEQYMAAHDASIDLWESDHTSGAVPWENRSIAAILAVSLPGDSIIVSEISRIARSQLGVLGFLQAAAAAEVEVIAVRSGIRLDSSMSSKIVVSILALAAEIERDLIRERTKAALASRRAAGITLGRPVGTRSKSKISHKAKEIADLLAAKVGKRAIARVLGVSPGCLYTFLEKSRAASGDTTTRDLFEESH